MALQPPYQQVQRISQTTSMLAIISLVMGILGWIGVVGIGPLVAIVTGHMAKNEMRESERKFRESRNPESQVLVTGNGIATAGLLLGYLNLLLIVFGLCLVVIIFFALAGIAVFVQMFGGN